MQFEVKTVSALESHNLQIESWQVDKKGKGSILDNSLHLPDAAWSRHR